MSRPSKKGLTKTQVMVAIAALGLDENGFRRTQKQVGDLLAMSKSTVSEAIRRLIDGQFIMESGKASRDKLYQLRRPRGPDYGLDLREYA